MKKTLTASILCLCLGLVALADDKKKNDLYEKKSDKERVYKVEYDALWVAAIAAAKEDFTLEQIHKEEGFFTFNSGAGFTTYGFNVNVSFTKEDEGGTRIKLNFHKKKAQFYSWGAGGKIAEKFFKKIDTNLAKQTPPK